MKVLILLLALLLPLPVQAEIQTPDKCLMEIGKAIDAGDVKTFEQLVDVDAILAKGLDVFLAQAARPENSRYMPPMLALMLSQAMSQADVRKLLLGEAKAFVLDGVSTGAFAGKKIEGAAAQGLLAPLFAYASIGRKEIRGIGQPVKDGENGWLLPFSVHDYGNGNDYAVIGRFAPVDKKLRLVSIENLERLFAQIRKEALGVDENSAPSGGQGTSLP